MSIIAILVIVVLLVVLLAAAGGAIYLFVLWLDRDREKPRQRGPGNDS